MNPPTPAWREHDIRYFITALGKSTAAYGLLILLFFYFANVPFFGKFIVVYFFIKTTQIVSLFGTNRLISHYLPILLNSKDTAKATSLLNLSYTISVISTMVGIVLFSFLIIRYLDSNYSYHDVLMLTFSFLFINLSYINRESLRALPSSQARDDEGSLSVIIRPLFAPVLLEFLVDILLILVAFSLADDADYFNMVIAQLVVSMTLLMVNGYSIFILQKQFNHLLLKAPDFFSNQTLLWIKESFFFMLTSAQNMLFYYISFFVLAASHGFLSVGIYAAAWLIFRIAHFTIPIFSAEQSMGKHVFITIGIRSVVFFILAAILGHHIKAPIFFELCAVFYLALLIKSADDGSRLHSKLQGPLFFLKNTAMLIVLQCLILYFDALGAAVAFLVAERFGRFTIKTPLARLYDKNWAIRNQGQK